VVPEPALPLLLDEELPDMPDEPDVLSPLVLLPVAPPLISDEVEPVLLPLLEGAEAPLPVVPDEPELPAVSCVRDELQAANAITRILPSTMR